MGAGTCLPVAMCSLERNRFAITACRVVTITTLNGLIISVKNTIPGSLATMSLKDGFLSALSSLAT
jgi:hypothetical protein